MKKIILCEEDIATLRDGMMIRASVDGKPIFIDGEAVVIAHKTLEKKKYI